MMLSKSLLNGMPHNACRPQAPSPQVCNPTYSMSAITMLRFSTTGGRTRQLVATLMFKTSSRTTASLVVSCSDLTAHHFLASPRRRRRVDGLSLLHFLRTQRSQGNIADEKATTRGRGDRRPMYGPATALPPIVGLRRLE